MEITAAARTTAAATTAAAAIAATKHQEHFRPEVLFTSLVLESESVKQQHEDDHEVEEIEEEPPRRNMLRDRLGKANGMYKPSNSCRGGPMAALMTTTTG